MKYQGKISYKLSHILFTLLFIFLLCTSSCAQEVKELTLSQAINLSIGINTGLKRSEQDLKNSISGLKVAEFETTYGLGSRFTHQHSSGETDQSGTVFGNINYKAINGATGTVELSPISMGNETSSISATLRQPLIKGKGRLSDKSNSILNARSQVNIGEKQLFITRQSTVQAVVQSYFQAVLAREQVKVQERALEVTQAEAFGARKRAEAGLIAEIDVARADIQLAQTKNQLNLQRQAAKTALDNLMTTIGKGIGQEPELIDNVPDIPDDTPTLPDAIITALQNRAEITIYKEQLTEQIRNLERSNDQLKSSLDATANYYSAANNNNAGSTYTAGVEYSFPLDKRSLSIDRDTAKSELDLLAKVQDFQKEQIIEQVRNAHLQVSAARASLDIFGKNLQIAQDNLRLAQRMVQEGLVANRDLLDAQNSLTSVEIGLLSAKIDLYLAYINLKYYMGENLTMIGAK